MNYYPLYLDIKKRRCVVVGGGDVAERKVERLVDCGAEVVVVAKSLTAKLEISRRNGWILHIDDEYRSEYIDAAFVVIGATDNAEINAGIYRDAEDRGLLVNIVDKPEMCNFIVPSVVQAGDLTVAISTGGKSPALARRLREDMEGRFGWEYEMLLNIMGELRERILKRGNLSEQNRDIFESLLDSDMLSYIREEEWGRLEKLIFDLTGEKLTVSGKSLQQ